MNKKYQILSKGTEFSDNYGRNKNTIIGVRINGRTIEKLLQNDKYEALLAMASDDNKK